MSLWELAACVDGYNRAQGGEEAPPAMSEAEFDDLLARNTNFLLQ